MASTICVNLFHDTLHLLLLGEKPEDIGGVKAMVTKQMKNFVGQQPKKGCPVRPLPSQVSVLNLCAARKQSKLQL